MTRLNHFDLVAEEVTKLMGKNVMHLQRIEDHDNLIKSNFKDTQGKFRQTADRVSEAFVKLSEIPKLDSYIKLLRS
jgi:hypothetical protein